MADARRTRNAAPGAGEQAEKRLRVYYALGREVLAHADEEKVSVKVAAEALTSSNTMSCDQAMKAARFATDFDENDLEILCELCVTPGHVPLVFTHIRRVLRVANQAKRMQLLRDAAEHGWSSARLDQEIGKPLDDTSDPGGPRLVEPRDLSDTLAKVRLHSQAWLKRYDTIWQHARYWPPELPRGKKDAAELPDRMEKEIERLRRLADAATNLSKRLGEVRKTRSTRGGSRGTSNGTSSGRRKRT